MFLKIDAKNGMPIYEQIVRQIKYAIADGALQEGELVPSVRELARSVAVNPNTVARSYQQLQSENILESVRGTGLAVRKSAIARCRKERTALIQQRIRDVLTEARQSRLDPAELREVIEQELKRIQPRTERE